MTSKSSRTLRIERPPYVPGGGDPATKLIPESVQVEIVESEKGTPLANLIDLFAGYSGTVTDYFGQVIPVSLERWRSADPATIKVHVRLRYKNRIWQ